VRRFWRLAGAAALGTGLVTVVAAAPALAAVITIPSQGGNSATNLNPGQSIYVGFDLTYPGQPNNYPTGAITDVRSISAVLSVDCVNNAVNPTQTTVTVPVDEQIIDGKTGSNGWYPSGNQASPLVYQGSLAMPNLCSGGTMIVGKQTMGPFSADVYSTESPLTSVSMRWHYGAASDLSTNGGNGSSWSATKSVTPDALPKDFVPVGTAGGVLIGGGIGAALLIRLRLASRRRATALATEAYVPA